MSNPALVDAEWLLAHQDDANVVIIEVDEDTAIYDLNHIRNAVRLDWKKDLQDPIRRDFVDQDQFSALLSSRGVKNDDIVVLYGGNNNWFAAYAYWYFKLYGHEQVRLLDGGRKKWELDSRELVSDVPERTPTTYRAKEQDTSIRAFRQDVLDAIGKVPARPVVLSGTRQIIEHRRLLLCRKLPHHLPRHPHHQRLRLPGLDVACHQRPATIAFGLDRALRFGMTEKTAGVGHAGAFAPHIKRQKGFRPRRVQGLTCGAHACPASGESIHDCKPNKASARS